LFERLKNLLKSTTPSNSKPSVGGRPPFEKSYPLILAAVFGYWMADLAVIYLRPQFLPEQAPPEALRPPPPNQQKMRMEYQRITSRNLFNADGNIPNALSKKPDQPGQGGSQEEGPAVPTELTQLVLIGTLVHANPTKSVATIENKTGAKVLPYFITDEIENLALVMKIERKRVIFRNTRNQRLEYIEIKDETAVTFGKAKSPAKAGEIVQQGNNFTLQRNDLDDYLKNFNDIIQQATAVPNFVPGGGGAIDGYRLIDIAPGSVYEKLGLKKGDVIKGVNGETVDSATKALELYNQLKSSNRVNLDIERNGSKDNLQYDIVK
jgi:general secretion pathway protein C